MQPTSIHAICDVSEAALYAGQLKEDTFQPLRTALNRTENPTDRLTLLLQYGKLLATHNFNGNPDYSATLTILEQAHKLAELLDDAGQLATALDLIGLTLYYRWFSTTEGDLNLCLTYFQQALEKRKAMADQRGVSETLFHMGLVCQNMEQDPAAEEYYTHSLQIAEQHNFKLEKSYAIRHLGFLQLGRGELDTALESFQRSLALREEIGFRIFLPFSHIGLGYVYAAKKDIDRARDHYQQAFQLAQAMDSKVQIIFSLLALGNVERDQAHFAQARSHYQQALSLAEAIDHRERKGVALARLAELDKLGV